MEEFWVLLEIEYKGNKYKVLSNKKFQKYFLKYFNDGTIMYPTMREFEELYNKFQIKSIQRYCAEINDVFKVKEKFKKGKIKLEPKVILKGTLISLALALTIISNNSKANSQNAETSIEQTSIPQVVEAKNINANSSTEKEIQLDKINDGIYMVTGFGNSVYCNSAEEFNKFIGIQNPTYDDIRAILDGNKNIAEKYKEIIRKGIDNLEEKLPNMNLSVLYFNLSRMRVLEDTEENIKNANGENTIAYFDKITGDVVINANNLDDETLLHEVIGHGSTCGIMQYENKIIYMCPDLTIYFEDENDVRLFGQSFSEAEADMIAKIAMGERAEFRQTYSAISEQLRIFMDTVGVDFTTLINKGTSYLVDEMYKNDIDNPFKYFEGCDLLCTAMKQGLPIIHPEMSVKHNIRAFFEDYSDDKLNRGESVSSITADIEKVMLDTEFCNLIVYNNDGFIAENIELLDLQEEIASSIEQSEIDINQREERE